MLITLRFPFGVGFHTDPSAVAVSRIRRIFYSR